MIPEENPAEVEAAIRRVIATQATPSAPGISVDIKRMLLANAMTPLAGNQPLVDAIQKHGQAVFGEPVPAVGTPLYTDVRLYVERGIPGVIYGAGPRTVLESHAKRADERLDLEDLRRATKVIARTCDLLIHGISGGIRRTVAALTAPPRITVTQVKTDPGPETPTGHSVYKHASCLCIQFGPLT
jgi:succinyl-diaminopimelate desuccinylase